MTSLTSIAAAQQRDFDLATSPSDRKERGHFGTPASIASFMAEMLSIKSNRSVIRVLDAGAGVGTLSAAVCETILRRRGHFKIYIEAWESDPNLFSRLRATLTECGKEFVKHGHELRFDLVAGDFILGRVPAGLFDARKPPNFDIAIMNPPYFKVRKESPHAKIMSHVVHGQPNIYSLFLARAAEMLVDGGELVAITPRSYFNGSYFRKFRKWFFEMMTVRRIHSFETRDDVFQEDDVLQENVILKAVKRAPKAAVTLTASFGRGLHANEETTVPYDKVIDDSLGDRIVRVAMGRDEQDLVDAIDGLPCRFRDLPFKVSTGPVVTFRSLKFLRDDRDENTAPLLWMHNVRPFVTQFPSKNGKPTHILVSEASKKLLLPTKRYVLLKRFTSKEESRRLVAGIFEEKDSYSPFVGLENHLNYIYRSKGELTRTEAHGLAGYFNSSIVDRYFRTVSGNTQVNATEIRSLPMPDASTLRAIGERLLCNKSNVDAVVMEVLELPESLFEQLQTAAP